MRAIRQSGSEGGAAGVTTGRPYPYQLPYMRSSPWFAPSRAPAHRAGGARWLSPILEVVTTAIWVVFLLDFGLRFALAPRQEPCFTRPPSHDASGVVGGDGSLEYLSADPFRRASRAMTSTTNVRASRSRAGIAALVLAVTAPLGAMALGAWTPWAHGLLTGVDVSHHQGRIDWVALARTDVRFAYVKATEGAGHVDPRFRENWQAARAARIPRGAYHFFTLCRGGAQQAENFLTTVARDDDALAPALDLEHLGPCRESPAITDVVGEVRTFLARVEAAHGRRPILYVTEEFHDLYLRPLRGERFWIRALFQRPTFREGEWVLWQHHNRGRRSGVRGPVDINALRGSLASLRAPR